MSFVSSKYLQENQFEDEASEMQSADPNYAVSMRIDVVPIPTESMASNLNLIARQNAAIKGILEKGQDLFVNNKTVMSKSCGKNLYQTADLYGQRLAVEDMIPMLTGSNLTLRVNALRSGSQAHASCFELKTGVLADLLNEASDSKNEKMTEVSVKNSSDIGKIYVGLKQERDGKHYIQKLDYEIDAMSDDRLHVK